MMVYLRSCCTAQVLMYRLMWVSETVKQFQDQYSPHAGTRHYELFIKVSSGQGNPDGARALYMLCHLAMHQS